MILEIFIMTSLLLQVDSVESQPLYNYELHGVWNRSREEEEDSVLIFRPEEYELPRVRGREKIEFLEGGRMIFYSIAPADGFIRNNGEFTIDAAKNILTIIYDSDRDNPVTFKILKLSDSILKLKRLQMSN